LTLNSIPQIWENARWQIAQNLRAENEFFCAICQGARSLVPPFILIFQRIIIRMKILLFMREVSPQKRDYANQTSDQKNRESDVSFHYSSPFATM